MANYETSNDIQSSKLTFGAVQNEKQRFALIEEKEFYNLRVMCYVIVDCGLSVWVGFIVD
jgi:hypothetical protein